MTHLSQTSRAKRLIRIFATRGRPGHWTGPFAELPAAAREAMSPHIAAALGEVAAIAAFQSPEEWVLATSDNLVVLADGSLRRFSWKELSRVEIDPGGYAEARNTNGRAAKLHLHRIKITLRDGSSVQVRVEPGKPFFGFLNALMSAAAMGGGSPDAPVTVYPQRGNPS